MMSSRVGRVVPPVSARQRCRRLLGLRATASYDGQKASCACLRVVGRAQLRVISHSRVWRCNRRRPTASFPGWNNLGGRPSRPERPQQRAGPPREEAGRDGRPARVQSDLSSDGGGDDDDDAGQWSPRRAAAAARRAVTWDERGVFVEEPDDTPGRSGDSRTSSRVRGASGPDRTAQRPPRSDGGGPTDHAGAAGGRWRPRAPTSPTKPAASGAARRVAEREQRLRDGKTAPVAAAAGGAASPAAARTVRKARFRVGRREDSVEQLRERETSLAAMTLPLPVANRSHGSPFVRLGLSEEAAAGLQAAGVARPTDIQTLAIPDLVHGMSAAVLAETGSGKTLAYCLPLATRLYAYAQLGKAHAMRRVPATACPEALIIVPNRELGIQVASTAEAAAVWCQPDDVARPLCVVRLLGKEKTATNTTSPRGRRGTGQSPQRTPLGGADGWAGGEGGGVNADVADTRAAFEAADIVVATPRTALQLQQAGRLRLGRCRTLVVDEADELLGPGFRDDVAKVVRSAAGDAGVGVFGQSVQLVCVAATLSRETWDEAVKPTFPVKMQRIASQGLHRPAPGVTQRVMVVHGAGERRAALLEALKDSNADAGGATTSGSSEPAPGLPALIFTNSPAEADTVAALLQDAGLPVAAYHGKVSGHRGELLDDLQDGALAALVVTDVAARGLDLPCVRNVVQWRPAPSATLHLHRVGRTGRASAAGRCQASVLMDPEDPEDTTTGAAPLVLRAAADGWDAVDDFIMTRRRE